MKTKPLLPTFGLLLLLAGTLPESIRAQSSVQLLTPSALADGRFQFLLTGATGHRYAILASSNLLNWTQIESITLAQASITVIDSCGPAFGWRFYRAVEFVAATYPTNGTYVPSDKYYGPGFEMESLGNTVVGAYAGSGGDNITVAHRFRAQKSGTLSTAQFYLTADATNTGYSRGNGGTIRISIQTNNPSTNTPSGTIVGTPIVYAEPFTNGISNDLVFKVLTFPSPQPQLTQGQLYHIVFENIHARPDLNYLSVDDAYVGDRPQTPREPLIPDLELETLLRFGTGSWSKRQSNVPIHALTYTDGFVQGQTYMEVWYDRNDGSTNDGSTTGIISGNQMIRQSLTPTQSKTVFKVHVRVGRVSGLSPLTISLSRSDGTVVGQGSVPAASIALENGFRGNDMWVATTFCSPVTLTQGQTYYLKLSAFSDTSYKLFAIREGTSYFPAALSFSDGQAEVTADGSTWSGWIPWPGATHTATLADLQMYFDLASEPLGAD